MSFALFIRPIPLGRRSRAIMFLTRTLRIPQLNARKIVRFGDYCGLGYSADTLMRRASELDHLVGVPVAMVEQVRQVEGRVVAAPDRAIAWAFGA